MSLKQLLILCRQLCGAALLLELDLHDVLPVGFRVWSSEFRAFGVYTAFRSHPDASRRGLQTGKVTADY